MPAVLAVRDTAQHDQRTFERGIGSARKKTGHHPRDRFTGRGGARWLALVVVCFGGSALADQANDGKALLERNCGRCHAVMEGAESPLKKAPNLWNVLGAYPGARLEVELGEGKASRHREMPQIQFSEEEIASIYYYLHGEGIGSIPPNEETGPEHP